MATDRRPYREGDLGGRPRGRWLLAIVLTSILWHQAGELSLAQPLSRLPRPWTPVALRLPPPPPGWTAAEFASLEEPPYAAEGLYPPAFGRRHVSRHKEGFFQKVTFQATLLDRARNSDFGLTELETSVSAALPLPDRHSPLLLTPGFRARLFEGPPQVDLPAHVIDAYLEALWLRPLSDRWEAILAVAPGVYTDGEQVDDQAVRVTGKGLVRFDWFPERLQLVAGVLYLDRDDVRVLPAGGVIWTPHDDARYELVFPRPKISRRWHWDGLAEDWVYIAGEFGGDTWSVERNGMNERMTLRDVRLLFGMERQRDGGAGFRLETGYVLDRTIEFSSGDPDFESPDTFLIRAGASY